MNKTVITKSSVHSFSDISTQRPSTARRHELNRDTGLSFNWDIYISTDYIESEDYLCDQKNLHFIGKQTSAE